MCLCAGLWVRERERLCVCRGAGSQGRYQTSRTVLVSSYTFVHPVPPQKSLQPNNIQSIRETCELFYFWFAVKIKRESYSRPPPPIWIIPACQFLLVCFLCRFSFIRYSYFAEQQRERHRDAVGGAGLLERGRDREEMRALCALLPGRHLQHVSSCLLASWDHRRPWNALSSGNLVYSHKRCS